MSMSITKKCLSCQKEFQPREAWHNQCEDCFGSSRGSLGRRGGGGQRQQQRGDRGGGGRGTRHEAARLDEECLLSSLYDNGGLRSEVFRGIPQKIAKSFENAGMKSTSIRRFYNMVRHAYDRYRFDPNHRFDPSREIIESLESLAIYSQTREVTAPCVLVQREMEFCGS